MYYLLLIFLIIYVFLLIYNINIIHIETLDGNNFLLYNNDDPEDILTKKKLLNSLINNMKHLKSHLVANIDNLIEIKPYIIQLNRNFTIDTKIYETNPNSDLTSYSVNKGQEVSFCMKSKISKTYHDLNLLTYVAIHEMAHFACPEIGHGELFQKIFKTFTTEAVNIGIYKKIDYNKKPVEYCGMSLNSSII